MLLWLLMMDYSVYFLNDNELSSLEEKINLQENEKLTFIRLTMLSGRIW